MIIRLDIDPSCRETEVIIRASEQTELTKHLVEAIGRCTEKEVPPIVACDQRGVQMLLSQPDIVRIYTESKKCIVITESGRYETQGRQSLRDLEEKLDKDSFARISRFEIVNCHQIAGFSFSGAGAIQIVFRDGTGTWVARRYIHAIQQVINHQQTKEGERHA